MVLGFGFGGGWEHHDTGHDGCAVRRLDAAIRSAVIARGRGWGDGDEMGIGSQRKHNDAALSPLASHTLTLFLRGKRTLSFTPS